MNAKPTSKSGIEQQLNAIHMSERARSVARHDARIAEMFVDAIVWVCNQAQRVGAGVFAKLSPKY